MEFSQVADGWLIWTLVCCVLLLVVIQTMIFIRKGWKEASIRGISNQKLKKAVISSITFSILPTLPIIVVLFALMPVLGIALPWLRLSIIGNAAFETIGATMAVQAVGETMAGAITPMAFVSAIWVMSLGNTSGSFIAFTIIRPICATYERFTKGSLEKITLISVCCLAGVISFISVANCIKSLPIIIVSACSFISAIFMAWLSKKDTKYRKITDYNLSISMVVGMIVAAFVV